MMRRRDVFRLGAVAAIVLVRPRPGGAQEAKTHARIAIMDNEASLEAPRLRAFIDELGRRGWATGRNLTVEARIGPEEQFPEFARQILQLGVDVIFAPKTTPAVTILRGSGIPVVFAVVSDPIGAGYVTSLARPGGNMTGTTSMLTSLGVKQLEMLKLAAPRARRVAVLGNRRPMYASMTASMVSELEAASKALKVDVHPVDWSDPARFAETVAAIDAARADAILMLTNIISIRHGSKISEFALKRRLPSVGVGGTFPDRGGLLSYGPDQVELYRRAATYVDRILRGAKPAELPVEQPSRFELVINTRTAKALGLRISVALLQRADRLVE